MRGRGVRDWREAGSVEISNVVYQPSFLMDLRTLTMKDCNESFGRIVGFDKESILTMQAPNLCLPSLWPLIKRYTGRE